MKELNTGIPVSFLCCTSALILHFAESCILQKSLTSNYPHNVVASMSSIKVTQKIKCKNAVSKKTLLFLFGIFAVLLFPAEAFAGINDIINGISTTLGEIKAFMSGIAGFFSKIASLFGFVGFKTIALLIGVFVISSGLTSTGVAGGKASFFLALAIIDAVIILWMMSFEDGLTDGAPALVKSNLFLIVPFLALWIVRKLVPAARRQTKRIAFAAIGQNAKLRRREVSEISRRLLEANVQLNNSISEDLDKSGWSGMSSAAKANIKEMKRLINALEKHSAKDNKINDPHREFIDETTEKM